MSEVGDRVDTKNVFRWTWAASADAPRHVTKLASGLEVDDYVLVDRTGELPKASPVLDMEDADNGGIAFTMTPEEARVVAKRLVECAAWAEDFNERVELADVLATMKSDDDG